MVAGKVALGDPDVAGDPGLGVQHPVVEAANVLSSA